MAMCSLILLSILKVGPKLVSAEEEATFVSECRSFALRYALLFFQDHVLVLGKVYAVHPLP